MTADWQMDMAKLLIFKNTIIVMTSSNIASQWIQDLTGHENEEEFRRRVKQALPEAETRVS